MRKCSAPSPFCECPKCFHAKHSVPAVVSCAVLCGGTESADCPDCKGTGNVLVMDCEGPMQAQCPCCLGTKRIRSIASRSHNASLSHEEGAK